MKFDEWYEKNKEMLTQKTFEGAFRIVWKVAWSAAIEKHWHEAQALGYREGYEAARKKDWEG